MRELEYSIYNTVRYFALFDMPVTAVQIWRSLVWQPEDLPAGRQVHGRRWQGQHLPSLADIQQVLVSSAWLAQKLGSKWGYVFLKGQEGSVRRRLDRHIIAQHKWRLTRRLARWLALMPFVRLLAGSGSLALSNTRPTSDLDMFVIAHRGRIWTTRLFLLAAAQLLGRRRKHWDEQAPDRLCFNHFMSDEDLTMPVAVRNLYTAVAYTHLAPLFGEHVFENFARANAAWMKMYLMYPEMAPLAPKQAVAIPSSLFFLKRLFENILLEPVGQAVERWAESFQRGLIEKHARLRPASARQGRIAVSSQELAFHPDSRVPDILRQFAQDAGQKALL